MRWEGRTKDTNFDDRRNTWERIGQYIRTEQNLKIGDDRWEETKEIIPGKEVIPGDDRGEARGEMKEVIPGKTHDLVRGHQPRQWKEQDRHPEERAKDEPAEEEDEMQNNSKEAKKYIVFEDEPNLTTSLAKAKNGDPLMVAELITRRHLEAARRPIH